LARSSHDSMPSRVPPAKDSSVVRSIERASVMVVKYGVFSMVSS
jgi:hypothetical protein